MTTAEQPPETPDVISAKSTVVQSGGPVELQALGAVIKGLVEPFADSQKTTEFEKTKRTQIEADTSRTMLRYSFGLAFFLVIVAVVALALGKDQLTEKIIFAVVGFIGGFGFGKISPHGSKE